ncbi:alpha/beta hydrolase family protein [Agromyces sp. NPDC060279]|uniref:alpha/beta hydrolase family protein n=1 Tax=Agromyces sp. NPDC060279 TaxID=3347092 RepID=UPI00365DC7F2
MSEISGTTSGGVPYTARAARHPGAPVVVAWHLLDPPNTPAAMAAALPLAGLDAHLVCLGLPLSGPRAVHDDFEALLASGVDLVTEFFGPMHEQANDEFPAAFAELHERLGADPEAPLVVLGGSAGASVAAEVAVTRGAALGLRATVLVNPMLRLRPMVDAMAEFLPEPYRWTDASSAVAARMDFVARADELRELGSPLLIVEGDADEAPFLDAVRAFERLEQAEVRYVPGVEHALAEWPGTDPAPQTDAARAYDRIVVDWLRPMLAR